MDLSLPMTGQIRTQIELTYAHLTPELVSGDSYATVIGSQFKWTDSDGEHTATYTGTPIDVPVMHCQH